MYLLGEQIIPTNTDWLLLSSGDPAQHQIGWLNFRQDTWHWPLTFTDNLGYPTGVSIAYQDSIPIFAIIFKLFSNVLPEDFQYFGIYALCSFILQFFWGAKLALLFAKNSYFCAICSGLLFMLAPPLTWRIHGHFALTTHWIILAAIWSYFKLNRIDLSGNRKLIFVLQVVLILIATGIHPYIAVMSFSVIVVSYLEQLVHGNIKLIKAFTSISVITLSLMTGWYLFGYLPNPFSNNSLNGYGDYSLNLNSLFNPMNFSSFLKSLPVNRLQYEGFNYLGLGILLLLTTNCLVILFKFKNKKIVTTTMDFVRSHIMLCLLVIFVTVFALSNKVYLQNILVLEYSVPIGIDKIAGSFRASGRFLWPVHYLILLGTLVTSFKIYPRSYLRIILILIVSLQFLDLIPLHHSASNWIKSKDSNINILNSPVWTKLNENHNKLIILPSHQCGKSKELWPWFEQLAAVQRLKTNSVYLPRLNPSFLQTHCEDLPQKVADGKLEEDAAYVFVNKADFINLYTNINNDINNSHYCSDVDDLILCQKRLSPKDKGNINYDFLAYTLGTKLDFTNTDSKQTQKKYQSGDWSSSGAGGTWTDGTEASLLMDINEAVEDDLMLKVKVNPFISAEHPKQVIDILVNGEKLTQWIFQHSKPQQPIKQVVIPAELVNQKMPLQITFKILNPASPKSLGQSDDPRQLGLNFITLQLEDRHSSP